MAPNAKRRNIKSRVRQKHYEDLQEDKPKSAGHDHFKRHDNRRKLELADRIQASAPRNSFIPLKDHKHYFISNSTCTLINPCKSEIGFICKNILDRINREITQATKVNLWESTKDTIE